MKEAATEIKTPETQEKERQTPEAASPPEANPDQNRWEQEKIRLEEQLQKARTEAGEYKKKYAAAIGEEEARLMKEAEERQKLESNYNELLQKVAVAENRARCVALGFEEGLAGNFAQALFEGNADGVFSCMQKQLAAVEKKLRGELIRETPRPVPGGATPGGETVAAGQFEAMGYQERVKLRRENPELYAKLAGGM